MNVKVSWPREATQLLRFPPVCAATGAPTGVQLRMVFRKEWTVFLPGLGRLIMNLTSPPVVLQVPVSDETRAEIRRWRIVSLAGALGALVLGGLLAWLLPGSIGSVMFFVGVLAALACAIFGGFKADVIGADVNERSIMITKAHPMFAQALVQSNPPGIVELHAPATQSWGPATQPWGPTMPSVGSAHRPNAGQPAQHQPPQPYGPGSESRYPPGQQGYGRS